MYPISFALNSTHGNLENTLRSMIRNQWKSGGNTMGTSSVHQNPKPTIPTQRITNLGHDQQQQTLKGSPIP
jgi:hypothetical protein